MWKRPTTPKTEEITSKKVSVIAPSTSQAGIKRPVTQEDREWALSSLAQLDRFTGLGWIIAPELPQTFDPSHHIKTFDGLLASSSYGDAEDKALYMLSSLAVSPQQKEAIERATVGQTKNALWMAYRRKRITASNFGLVLAAVKRNSYPPSLFKTLLGHYNLKQGAHACDWGIVHEQKAKEEYMKRTGVTFQESGVFLSDSGLLGGSPDGLVSDDCIIEFMNTVRLGISSRSERPVSPAQCDATHATPSTETSTANVPTYPIFHLRAVSQLGEELSRRLLQSVHIRHITNE
uniref:YqaJ viral recombinase domain-containing protein n=2 Tax=Knipowitschia caucasica TaxID=637954 RepID=A0AAV2JRC3_KNICA